MSTDPIAVVRSAYAALAARDGAAMAAVTGADIVVEQSDAVPWGGRCVGAAGSAAFNAAVAAHLDSTVEIHDLYARVTRSSRSDAPAAPPWRRAARSTPSRCTSGPWPTGSSRGCRSTSTPSRCASRWASTPTSPPTVDPHSAVGLRGYRADP